MGSREAARSDSLASPATARVNGRALQQPHERLDEATLRQRACAELLRQAAQQAGLLAKDDPSGADGVQTQAASDAIERLLEGALRVPEPDEAACRRHHAGQPARWRRGERVRVRHILFAVTPGVDVRALRARAEATLLALRCEPDDQRSAAFAREAGGLSNCPSGAHGGELDWLRAEDCAPEFARELFGKAEVGVLPRLVHSRFGLHVVEVLAREAGEPLSYEQVRDAVARSLQRQAWVHALQQYLQVLAGASRLEGVALESADSPLVQ